MEDGLITTKEVGDYRIKIYYDPDGTCPCKYWDMAGGVAVAPGRPVPAWPGRGCEWQ